MVTLAIIIYALGILVIIGLLIFLAYFAVHVAVEVAEFFMILFIVIIYLFIAASGLFAILFSYAEIVRMLS